MRNGVVRKFAVAAAAALALSNGAFGGAVAAAAAAAAAAFTPAPRTSGISPPGRRFLPGADAAAGIRPGRSAPRLWLFSSALERGGGGGGLGGEAAEADDSGVEIHVDGDYEDFEGAVADEDAGDEDVDDDGADASPARLLLDALSASIERALASVEKKSSSLRNELNKAKDLEATMARANLIVSNLYRLPPGATKATVEDWENGGEEIELVLDTDKYSSAQEESDALFAVARKMKRGSRVVEELLEKTDAAREVLEDGKMDLEAAATHGPDGGVDEGMVVLIQERMERAASRTGFKVASVDDSGMKQRRRQHNGNGNGGPGKRSARYQPTFRRLTSPSGLRVLVGRNRRDNEAICFQVARGDDVWMHARGRPGAHVLLQVRRGSAAGPPADADLQFAADLAAFYSDARTERKAAVTVAEPKHILKPRGAPPGAVKLRKEGPSLVGRPQDVAEDLKAAREESGGAWDETGYQKLGGRARNKKRTEEARRQSLAKRRAEKRQRRKRRHRLSEDETEWS